MMRASSRLQPLIALLVFAVPACVVAVLATTVPEVGRDVETVRLLGARTLGTWGGTSRTLDAVAGAASGLLPVATHAARVCIASGMLVGVTAWLLWMALRRSYRSAVDATSTMTSWMAVVVPMAAVLSTPWLTEAAQGLSSVLAALLVLVPGLVVLARSDQPRLALAVAVLALSYDLGIGLAAACGLLFALSTREMPSFKSMQPWIAAAVLLLGLRGLGWALKLRDLSLATNTPSTTLVSLRAFASSHVGLVVGTLALLTLVTGALQPALRRHLAPWIAWTFAAGFGATFEPLSLPLEGAFGWPALVLVVSSCALAGFCIVSAMAWLTARKIAFARTNSTLLLLLFSALPVVRFDSALSRLDEARANNQSRWDLYAFGTMPQGAVALIADERMRWRMAAARMGGGWLSGVAMMDPTHPASAVATRVIAQEPRLHEAWRALLFQGRLSEFGLSLVAESRPVLMHCDPKYDRALLRHLMPTRVLSEYEREPRALSDRKRALENARRETQAYARLLEAMSEGAGRQLGVQQLRRRVLCVAAAGDRDLVPVLAEDVMRVTGQDAFIDVILRRAREGQGSVDVKDLQP